jgi:RNA polymerase sigma factor (TIGR02999 family)
MSTAPDSLTSLLHAAAAGDKSAAARLVPAIYDELKAMAVARMGALAPGQTLQPTALVHEAYMKLLRDPAQHWDGRAHFFGAAARAMRDILVDRARSRGRLKRGGDRRRVELTDQLTVGASPEEDPVDLVALDAALSRLSEHDARAAEVVMLRFFGGLDIEQTAKALGVSVPTVNRDWRYARAFLASQLEEQPESHAGADDTRA